MDEKEQIIDNFHKLIYENVRKVDKNIKYPDPQVEKHIEIHLFDVFGEDTKKLHKQFQFFHSPRLLEW